MKKVYVILFVALLLGLAWAIRGHFGHEWGAAWAGGIGALAIIVGTNKKGWVKRAPVIASLGALGWGLGGIMSYGIVIGYCRGSDFANVLYGYTMLAVIGGLYGLAGGGFIGLILEASDIKKPKWHHLFAEMVTGAIVFWGFIIYQLEWFMTPPRSELWAACFGAGIAMVWHLYRNGYTKALRVAVYSMIGAGLGFTLGNFVQTMGASSGVVYNWWNVMEFILGFLGGAAMAYAVVTTKWDEVKTPSKLGNWVGIVFLAFIIPATNHINAMTLEKFSKLGESMHIGNIDNFVSINQLLGWGMVFIFCALAFFSWKKIEIKKWGFRIVPFLLFGSILLYILFGTIVKGYFLSEFYAASSLHIYWIIGIVAIVIWTMQIKGKILTEKDINSQETLKYWVVIVISFLLLLIIVTLVSINSHDVLPGNHERF